MSSQTEISAETPGGGPLYFDAVLRPHRSLGPTGFVILMSAICGVSFAYGVVFIMIGAWPIFGFLGLDALLIYIAFRLSYRSGRLHETVQVSDRDLRITRVHPNGKVQSWRFNPYWVRVHMDDPPEHHSMLTVSSHGRQLAIGSFLTPEERLDFSKALKASLQRAAGSPSGN